jgi:DNA-directed RNA polymerase specialized sigma subunit, sigma24 homolog
MRRMLFNSRCLKPGKGSITFNAEKEKAYLARIVINECHNIQRRRQRVTPVFAFPEQSKDHLTAEVCVLKESLNAIPEKLRTPFLLVYMEGYSEKEAAEALGITLYSVKIAP